MYRIIYFSPENGYATFDSADALEISRTQRLFDSTLVNTICLVDYRNRAITHKSIDYNKHRDQIEDIIFDPRMLSRYPGY